MGQYGRELAIPWVLDAHNVEYVTAERLAAIAASRPYRLYGRRQTTALKREEAAVWRSATSIVCTSPVDRERIKGDFPDAEVDVAPNAIDVDRFAGFDPAPERSTTILFVGKADYRPNSDAIRWFCGDILPLIRERRPDAKFRVIGASFGRGFDKWCNQPGVSFAGVVPDVLPDLRDAAVVVAPLRSGSGTRLKLLEAFAAGRPVVTTTVGSEGLPVEHDRHVLVADTPRAFADAVLALLEDPARGRRLAASASALVRELNWAHTARVVTEALGRACGASHDV
jgi:glycosyltransferase involved in cell wall biosynthesis